MTRISKLFPHAAAILIKRQMASGRKPPPASPVHCPAEGADWCRTLTGLQGALRRCLHFLLQRQWNWHQILMACATQRGAVSNACSACGVAEALGRRQTVNDLRQQIQDLRRQLDNERSRAERAEFEREDALDQNDVLNKRWVGAAGQGWPVVRWAVSSQQRVSRQLQEKVVTAGSWSRGLMHSIGFLCLSGSMKAPQHRPEAALCPWPIGQPFTHAMHS